MSSFILGMGIYGRSDLSIFNGYINDLKDNKIFNIREGLTDYTNSELLTISKECVLSAINSGMNVVWGVYATSLTAANWADYEVAVLDAAAWAETNKVYEFQIGNELEYYVDGITLTVEQLITNLKLLATAVKAIYTRGKISYSCAHNYINSWASAGKGDLDFLASNIYMGGLTFDDTWKTEVNTLINTFGDAGCYLSEFSLSYISLDSYSTDEFIQSQKISEMLEYIKSSGISRAYFFEYIHNNWGARKETGIIYRQLWDVLIKETGGFKYSSGTEKIRGLSHG